MVKSTCLEYLSLYKCMTQIFKNAHYIEDKKTTKPPNPQTVSRYLIPSNFLLKSLLLITLPRRGLKF